MASSPVGAIVSRIRELPPHEQIQVAEAVDRMTWAERWRRTCRRIEEQLPDSSRVTDKDIDDAVRAVRREKPLSERSSTHPS